MKRIGWICRAAVLALGLVPAVGSADGEIVTGGPENSAQFVELASGGFGRFPGGVGGNPIGDASRSYIWSDAWFRGKYYAGIIRHAFDAENTTLAGRRAEIWVYTPGGTTGAQGDWERVYEAPVMLRFLGIPVARDVGYRGMIVCDAGDGRERLYVATIGLVGGILYSEDGQKFRPTSLRGLRPVRDIGYRALACVDGWLYTAAAGTMGSSDATNRPVVLGNPNPLRRRWQEVSRPGFGNPDNSTVFSMTGFDTDGDGSADALVAGALNGVDGLEVFAAWDTCPATDSFRSRLLSFLRPCHLDWDRVVVRGAFREDLAPDGIRSDGASVMQQFGDKVYIGASRSRSFTRDAAAEVLRLHTDGSVDIVVGSPRSAANVSAGNTLFGTKINCNEIVAGTCMPLSGLGPGFGEDPETEGRAEYAWMMAVHAAAAGKYLYVSTFENGLLNPDPTLDDGEVEDLLLAGLGYDLWRTADGVSWERVLEADNGNPLATGGRSLESTPYGLFVGTANSQTTHPLGGAAVLLGRCFEPDTDPLADAGTGRVYFDTAGDGEQILLNGKGSGARACGAGIGSYLWRSGGCLSPGAEEGTTETVALSQGPGTQTYSLTVTDTNGRSACDDVEIEVSTDLPPIAAITSPLGFPPFPGALPAVAVPDPDGDGFVDVPITGSCSDPEGMLASCEWLVAPSSTLAAPPDVLGNTVTVPVGLELSFRGVVIWLVATDVNGYQSAAGLTIVGDFSP
ncbi:MAG: hypothetical protein PVG98_12625 [Chromatiales bacterium]